ncbi:glycosyltransferase family 2 protein [Massilia sp. TS11]|uniref:glycosyltransferase family 2 protein n=1 Tax=Massilia sp. TS11 TaxID=2908003 RepID=UPI001EDB6B4B|nr:glycosyltransferase [Massilia sp. TS11]MCG2582843.1 glycosyltransferase [Massilia sp. TS11]
MTTPPRFLEELALQAPRTRAEAQLQAALGAFQAGQLAEALIGVETLCRSYPRQIPPHLLRAKILEQVRPALNAKAWFQPWIRRPHDPQLQDLLLKAWQQAGATRSVRELLPALLPARARAGTADSLLAIAGGSAALGACWKTADGIAARVLRAPQAGAAQVDIVLACETRRYPLRVPADGRVFQIPCPTPGQVWSLAFSEADGGALFAGSPLVFATPAPAADPRPAPPEGRPVGVVIPVYRSAAMTRACIDSVLASLAHNRTPTAVLVVDDASPESELRAWLDAQAAAGRINLLRNPYNLGFIETCNRAMRALPDFDVLLLNADTLVHGDWIDRLRAALHAAPDIASAAPWSNNGEICSFPRIVAPARMPTAAQLARIDSTAAALHAAGSIADIDLPTCCGFAVLLRREAIDAIGGFDGATLNRGYNEEVDWCLRARAAGYRHRLASGVFVAHAGTVSFRFEKTVRVHENLSVLYGRYPQHAVEYQGFLVDDGARAPRAALLAALQAQGCDWTADCLATFARSHEVARTLPPPLATRTRRIAIWQHRLGAHTPAILQLARGLASAADGRWRLLLIGEANEALVHTGVLDALPAAAPESQPLISDTTLVGLAGCELILAEPDVPVPAGVRCLRLDADFDPQRLLQSLLGPVPKASKRRTQTAPDLQNA